MGTNYYVEQRKCEHCGRSDEPLHIGKSSGGWQFLFAPYPELGLTSWRLWRAFLALPENRDHIRNEYGAEVSLADLTLTVEGEGGKRRELWSAETAPDSAYGSGPRSRYETADPEGYRFSTTADFS